MSKEFQVTPEMDRIPLASQTEAEQIVSVTQDQILLKLLRRGLVCGCGGCQGDALNGHERIRGQLPVTNPFDKNPVPPPSNPKGKK